MEGIQRTGTPSGGQTQTQTQHPAPSITTTAPRQQVLHLRGATRESQDVDGGEGGSDGQSRRRIQWAVDVVDNEGLGRKSSKVCCIYHAPRDIDESSDESSSDSDDGDSDSGDDGAARPARRGGHNHDGHNHNHNHNHGHGNGHGDGKGKGRARSPNAYEKVPKPKSGGTKDKG